MQKQRIFATFSTCSNCNNCSCPGSIEENGRGRVKGRRQGMYVSLLSAIQHDWRGVVLVCYVPPLTAATSLPLAWHARHCPGISLPDHKAVVRGGHKKCFSMNRDRCYSSSCSASQPQTLPGEASTPSVIPVVHRMHINHC